MNVLEKILKEIEERLNMVESIPVNEDDDFLDGEECYEDGRTQGRFKELLWCRDIIRSHMDEARDTNVPSNDGWIPVEKKLPEEKMEVLCCFENGTVQSLWQNWKNDGLGDYFDDDLFPAEVIAWQPLPKAYRRHQKIIPTRCKATYNGQIYEREVEIDMQGTIKIKNVPETCKDCQFHSYTSGCMLKKKNIRGI